MKGFGVARMSIRVLLDTGAFIQSEFAELAVKEIPVRWGPGESVLKVYGLKKKQQPVNSEDYRKQKEAMFTVGRMIREERIEAYTSIEIEFERFRGSSGIQEFNALQGCKVRKCDPALERSRFRKTSDLGGSMAKGGKKDRRSGTPGGEATQIAFLEWLCALDRPSVNCLIQHAPLIGLSPFEIHSLENLDWFKFVCKRSGSSENYPDVDSRAA